MGSRLSILSRGYCEISHDDRRMDVEGHGEGVGRELRQVSAGHVVGCGIFRPAVETALLRRSRWNAIARSWHIGRYHHRAEEGGGESSIGHLLFVIIVVIVVIVCL